MNQSHHYYRDRSKKDHSSIDVMFFWLAADNRLSVVEKHRPLISTLTISLPKYKKMKPNGIIET